MKRIFSRKGLVLGSVIILLMTTVLAAQTQTRSRPPLRSNNQASYRYAYEHGYRAGYEDGYTQGREDFSRNRARDFARNEDYRHADRGYESRLGDLSEYQAAYRVGFELAYNDGYYGRPYTVSIPPNLAQLVVRTDVAAEPPRRDDRRYDDRPSANRRGEIYVPDGVQLKIRLTSGISTKTNREGDRFTAVVLDPSEYAEATITGHIAKLSRSGRATGKTEMALAFDTITLRDGRTGNFAAQVERVYESETVKTVDEEGNVESSSRGKDTATRGVGGGALGAIIGGIAGGGKGAAIGAIIGAGVGAGSVYIQGGKDLMLDPGTEMLIRSNAPSRSR
jgi:outer membrane lipoprotein SlyB